MTTEVPAAEPELAFLDLGERRLAIRHRAAPTGRPTVVFLPGYASDMAGQKALAIDQFCARTGLSCLRMDYSGTGQSDGAFADGTLARWIDDVLGAIDRRLPDGSLILAGSSMGGWIALHAALRRPARVVGLLGIAAAPDFTNWGYSDDDKAVIERDGVLRRANRYGPEPSLTHRAFWQSGEALRLLDAPIELAIPVRLVHGDQDREVPVAVVLELVERLGSADVQLRVIKGGGHRLSEPREIRAILAELAALVELIEQ